MDMTLWDEMTDFFNGVGSGFVFWSGWDDMGDWFDNLPDGVTGRCSISSSPQIKVVTENYFSCSSTKTYVVGTQKNFLDETGILSTQTHV